MITHAICAPQSTFVNQLSAQQILCNLPVPTDYCASYTKRAARTMRTRMFPLKYTLDKHVFAEAVDTNATCGHAMPRQRRSSRAFSDSGYFATCTLLPAGLPQSVTGRAHVNALVTACYKSRLRNSPITGQAGCPKSRGRRGHCPNAHELMYVREEIAVSGTRFAGFALNATMR